MLGVIHTVWTPILTSRIVLRRFAWVVVNARKKFAARRKRREKITRFRSRLDKASQTEKTDMARKLRSMTPGSEVLIEAWSLAGADR